MSSEPLLIQAGRPQAHYWRDLWRHRELFYFLAWRDVLVRYKQTVLGVGWTILRPLLTVLIFCLIFGKLARFPSGGVPYSLFVLAALIPWQLFSAGLGAGGESLLNNAHLVSKVYFPRLIIPASAVLVALLDFLITGVLLVLLMLWYGVAPAGPVWMLPAFILLAAAGAFATALWISALNVRYRDWRAVTPFLIQVGTYLSPVGFAASLVPERWRPLYDLNPAVGIIEGFRWSLFGAAHAPSVATIGSSVAVIGLLLITGLIFFRKTERIFADVI